MSDGDVAGPDAEVVNRLLEDAIESESLERATLSRSRYNYLLCPLSLLFSQEKETVAFAVALLLLFLLLDAVIVVVVVVVAVDLYHHISYAVFLNNRV